MSKAATATVTPATPSSPLKVTLAALVLVLAVLAAYHNSFSGPLVFDDVPAIKDNPTIVNLGDLGTVLSPPSDSGITVNGRPLVNLSLAINYAISKTDVWSYHVTNLLIHLAAGLTLFGLVRRTLQLPAFQGRFEHDQSGLWVAFVTALLWTLHPLQTESVTYIIQRAESLVGLFYLLTFYCFVRSVTSPNQTLWRAATIFACLCGIGSKEVMASAPLLVLFYDRAFVSGSFREALARNGAVYLGLAATWLPLAWLVHGTSNRGGTAGFGAGGVSSWHYALTSALAIGKYLKLTFWPHPLVFDYGVGLERDLIPVLPQALLIVSLMAATTYALWRHAMLGFLGLWFFAILGPSSSIIPIASETMAEHRMYLPLAAIVTLVVVGAAHRLGRSALVVLVILGVMAGVLTTRRNSQYSSETKLWTDTQQAYPANARAHNNVGEILFRQDKFDEAIDCFREAVRLLPTYLDALNNLGNSLTQRGNPEAALEPLTVALRHNANYAETHNNLGTALYKLGRVAEAVPHYREAIRLKAKFAEPRSNLSVILVETGQYAEAIELCEAALKIKPDYRDAHYNYGNALVHVGRTEEAQVQYEIILKEKSDDPKANNNLGTLLYNKNKFAESIPYFRAAVQAKPDYVEAHYNLGLALLQSNLHKEALPSFETTARLNPQYPGVRDRLCEIHNLLGAEFLEKGDLNEAARQFEIATQASPTEPNAYNNLGVVYLRAGKVDEARAFFQKAIQLNPEFTEAKQGLVDLEAQLKAAKAKL